MRRGALAILAAILGTSVTSSAAGATNTAHLVYVRGDLAQCPEEEEIKNAVSARLGYDPFDARSTTTVTAVITRDRGGLRANVDLRNQATGTGGRRELSSARSDCSELASAMELAIAIAIDPRSLLRPAGSPPVEATPAPPPPPVEEPPAIMPAPEAPRDPVRVRVGALGSFGYGTTPSLAVAPVLFAGVRWRSVSLAVDGRFQVPTGEDASPSGSVRGSLIASGLLPCAHLGVGVACAVVLVGRFHGEGRGVDVPHEESAIYLASGLRLGVELPVGHLLYVPLSAEALGPLTPEKLYLRDVVVWRSPAVTVSALVGMGAHF
jgi:hypothetical protein